MTLLITDLIKERKDLPQSLLRDMLWLVGKQICELIKPLTFKEEPNVDSSINLIMQSDLLSGGLQTHLFGYFSEEYLTQMELDASLGVVDEVLQHISDAKATLKNDLFKSKFKEDDEKWLEIIH